MASERMPITDLNKWLDWWRQSSGRAESDIIPTWTAEQRRQFRDQLLRQWEENTAQELAEDDRRDSLRGYWGD